MMEDAHALFVRGFEDGCCVNVMKELLTITICALLVVVLSPMIGFWVVALVGSAMALLPLGAALSQAFPKAWAHMSESAFGGKTHLSAS